jgi:hypothetical protein
MSDRPRRESACLALVFFFLAALVAGAAALYQWGDWTHLTPPAERGPDGKWR